MQCDLRFKIQNLRLNDKGIKTENIKGQKIGKNHNRYGGIAQDFKADKLDGGKGIRS